MKTELYWRDPSELNNSYIYEAIQKKEDQKIYDNRPSPDNAIPPVELLDPRFGDFIDARKEALLNEHVVAGGLEAAADEFADAVCAFGGENENDKMDDTVNKRILLCKVLDLEFGDMKHAVPDFKGRSSDGYFTRKDDTPFCIIEYKPENAPAEAQLAGFHVQITVGAPPEARTSRNPALGVIVRGQSGFRLVTYVFDMRLRTFRVFLCACDGRHARSICPSRS